MAVQKINVERRTIYPRFGRKRVVFDAEGMFAVQPHAPATRTARNLAPILAELGSADRFGDVVALLNRDGSAAADRAGFDWTPVAEVEISEQHADIQALTCETRRQADYVARWCGRYLMRRLPQVERHGEGYIVILSTYRYED